MTLYEVRARGQYGGSTSWSFGYMLNSTEALSSVESAWDAAITAFWTTAADGYANLCNADVTLVDTVTYTLNPSLRVLNKAVTANAHPGTNAHDSLAFNTAVWVAQVGQTDTKSDRGGFFLPTPSNDNLVAEVWTPAFVESLQDILDPLFVSMRALAGYSAVKVNKHVNKQGEAAFTQHLVDTYKIGNKPASLRKRTKKRKPTIYVTGTV